MIKLTRRAILNAGIIAAAAARLGRSAHDVSTLNIGGATIGISVEGGPPDVSTQQLLDWVGIAARAVTSYFERFPVPQARVEITIVPKRRGVLHGTSYGEHGVFTRIAIGQHTTASDLWNDWTMTHEFVHYGFPSVRHRHNWIEEGSATYIEPIARAQVKNLTDKQVWGEMVRGMPQGLPKPGEPGLDFAHTWASTYWGGAIFCLLADVRIRRRTDTKKGLEDAFRAINHAGGNITVDWPLARAFEIGDRATGGTTLAQMYQQMGLRHWSVDLRALWRELGVEPDGRTVSFKNRAPLAAVRQAICT